MRNTRLGLTLLAGLMASTQAAAVYTEGYDIPYFSGLYAYESSDSAREAEDGNGYQLSIGIPLSPKTSFELTFYDVGRERALDGNKDYQTALFLDWTRDLGTFGWESSASLPRFKPFGIIGFGAVEEDVLGDKHMHFGANVGLGLLFPLTNTKGWAIRTEARAQIHQNSEESVAEEDLLMDYRVMVGLQIPLTPFFNKGAGKGADCELAVVDVESGRKDCAADSDRDGVADGADQCPGTPAGTLVDRKGCPVTSGFVLKGVNFKSDSAKLTNPSKKILDEVAATLAAANNDGITVEVSGHTDSQGNDDYNLKLSEQRAESVRQYLIGKGINATRLRAAGYGETQPLADNDTQDGRLENRRVEFKIVVE